MKTSMLLAVMAVFVIALPSHADYLQAGVSVDTEITSPKSVPPGFREGVKFDTSSIDTLSKEDTWARIPNEMPGFWTTEEVVHKLPGMASLRKAYKTQVPFRCLMDSQGQFWVSLKVPAKSFGESETSLNYGVIVKRSALETPNVLKLQQSSINSSVDKKTGVVSKTTQSVAIDEFTPLGNDKIQLVSTFRDFNQDGQPISLVAGFSDVQRQTMIFSYASPIEATETDRQSFVAFLKDKGLAHLIPGGVSTAQKPIPKFSADEVEKMADETGIKFAPNKEALLKQFKRSK